MSRESREPGGAAGVGAAGVAGVAGVAGAAAAEKGNTKTVQFLLEERANYACGPCGHGRGPL